MNLREQLFALYLKSRYKNDSVTDTLQSGSAEAKREHTHPSMQLLLSTMNRTDLTFLDNIISPQDLAHCSVLVVNQSSEQLSQERPGVNTWTTPGIGLSKSRNMALQRASAGICLFADDDLVYYDGFAQAVSLAHQLFPSHALILFQLHNAQRSPGRVYAKQIEERNVENSAAVMSCEISFKLNAVRSAGIRFDERFGLNATFVMGEERIFVADCIAAGLRVLEIPVPIVMHAAASSGMKPEHRTSVQYCHGAAYARIYGEKEALRRFGGSLMHVQEQATKELLDDYFYFFKGIIDYARMSRDI